MMEESADFTGSVFCEVEKARRFNGVFIEAIYGDGIFTTLPMIAITPDRSALSIFGGQ